MKKRIKHVFVLVGVTLLFWSIAFSALAQSYNSEDSSLYDQYSHHHVRGHHAKRAHAAAKRRVRRRKKLIRRKNMVHRRKEFRRRKINRRLIHQRHIRALSLQNARLKRSKIINLAHQRRYPYPPSVFHPYMRQVQPVQVQPKARLQQKKLVAQNVADLGEIDSLGDESDSITPDSDLTSLTEKTPTNTKKSTTKYNGRVDFLMGHDDNLDPNRSGVSDAYYQVDPSLGFDSDHWSGNVRAMMLDYENQQVSDTNQKQEAEGVFSYKDNLTQNIKSTTTIDGLYHSEKWPDYINGPDTLGLDHGMPLRYTLAKLTETVDYNLGSGLTAQTGAYVEHLESSELFTDWAPNSLDPLRFRPSYNQYSGFGQIAYQATPWVQFALVPSVSDQDFTERQALQADGSPGGNQFTAPLFQLITSELDFNTNFKFGDTTFTPTLQVGQANDPVYGGDTNSYYGGGLSGKIMLDKDLNFYISPSAVYTQWNYSNFQYMLSQGTYRQDGVVTYMLTADINITKTVGWEANYTRVEALSNVQWSFLNYNEDVVDTGIFFAF